MRSNSINESYNEINYIVTYYFITIIVIKKLEFDSDSSQ